jgi:hypothetical protein
VPLAIIPVEDTFNPKSLYKPESLLEVTSIVFDKPNLLHDLQTLVMFNIASITTATGNHTSTLSGGLPGNELIGTHGPLGPEGASYILAFPSLGYIKLLDQGNKGNTTY